VHRIQQILDEARRSVAGRCSSGARWSTTWRSRASSATSTSTPTREVAMEDVERHDRSELIVVSTGSQGEPFSALSLMASGDHRHLALGEGDLVILASSLIPGNEQAVFRSINNLARRGVDVVHGGIARSTCRAMRRRTTSRSCTTCSSPSTSSPCTASTGT
jgi:ribonuclease J